MNTTATPSLLLDSRQRAMLQAMGVELWATTDLTENTSLIFTNLPKNTAKTVINTAQAAPLLVAIKKPVLATPPFVAVQPLPATQPASVVQVAPPNCAHLDWPQLQAAVNTCTACALCTSRKNPVFGSAAVARADWLIVGDAPSEEEDAQGEPFTGAAGQLLDNMLRSVSLLGTSMDRRSNVFLVNALKCRAPANRNPSSEELAQCRPYLLRQIELLQPKLIVAMGKLAAQQLVGSSEPLGKLRGRVHSIAGFAQAIPVVVTYQPDYLLRSQADKAKAWQDLLLAISAVAPA